MTYVSQVNRVNTLIPKSHGQVEQSAGHRADRRRRGAVGQGHSRTRRVEESAAAVRACIQAGRLPRGERFRVDHAQTQANVVAGGGRRDTLQRLHEREQESKD